MINIRVALKHQSTHPKEESGESRIIMQHQCSTANGFHICCSKMFFGRFVNGLKQSEKVLINTVVKVNYYSLISFDNSVYMHHKLHYFIHAFNYLFILNESQLYTVTTSISDKFSTLTDTSPNCQCMGDNSLTTRVQAGLTVFN